MPEEGPVSDALQTARTAALAGGEVLRAKAANITGKRSKATATDFVSDVDIAAGVAVVRAILESDPAARFVVEEPEVFEETGIAPGSLDDERVWVIDPLDGTTSYLHGYPCYSVSVALLVEGQPVAGAVYNAASNEMNSAGAGLGAYRDSTRLAVTSAAAIDEALLITGFPYDRTAPLDRQLRVLGEFLRTPVHGIRRDGSAAVDCCHVAGARADGYWEFTLLPWDMAAGVLIAREAGARVTDTDGAEWSTRSAGLIVANAALHSAMLEVIRSVG